MRDEELINKVTIVNLADDTKHIEEVSLWSWEEWSKAGGKTLEEVVFRTRHSICKDKVPQVYIAKLGEELVGTVSLWHNDLSSRQDLTPWLASLYIKKEYRGKGLGTLLQQKCIEVTKELGYNNLYLITDHENYYERTGWVFLDMAPLNGKTTRVYKYEITR